MWLLAPLVASCSRHAPLREAALSSGGWPRRLPRWWAATYGAKRVAGGRNEAVAAGPGRGGPARRSSQIPARPLSTARGVVFLMGEGGICLLSFLALPAQMSADLSNYGWEIVSSSVENVVPTLCYFMEKGN